MTADEIKAALSDRGLTDAIVRLDYAGGSYRVSVERQHSGRHVSYSKRVDLTPPTGDLDTTAHEGKQWWDEVRE